MFLIVKLTAGRVSAGAVELAINDDAEVVARYPTALIFTARSGRPAGMSVVEVAVLPAVVFCVAGIVVSGRVITSIFFGVDVATGAVDVASVELTSSPNEIVVEVVGTTKREGEVVAGVKTELK
jgi:hypothetical protein